MGTLLQQIPLSQADPYTAMLAKNKVVVNEHVIISSSKGGKG
jgi:hypothetical protein